MVTRTPPYFILVLFCYINIHPSISFTTTPLFSKPSLSTRHAQNDPTTTTTEYIDEDAPAEVAGAEFFGGRAEKEELFDPDAEEKADEGFTTTVVKEEEEKRVVSRWDWIASKNVRDVAMALQKEFCRACSLEDEPMSKESLYGKDVKWTSPFSKNAKNPMDEIRQGKSFYKKIDVAILHGTEISSNEVELRWEICLIWPNPWESRILLTGTSILTLDNSNKILSQRDALDEKDIMTAISRQITPRFWDFYHVGITPSAQLVPRINPKTVGLPFSNLKVYDIPPSIVIQPSLVDTGGRAKRRAQVLPNHAFTTAIKTMGPKKQRYIPTSPLSISISKAEDVSDGRLVMWTVHIPTEFLASTSDLNMPPSSSFAEEEKEDDVFSPKFEYAYISEWSRIATLPYSGNPQDDDIPAVRKKLYESIVKNGTHKPKVDEHGKPVFFFVQGDCKTCFTVEGGLGMAVYEGRPGWVKGNEIGMELEVLDK